MRPPAAVVEVSPEWTDAESAASRTCRAAGSQANLSEVGLRVRVCFRKMLLASLSFFSRESLLLFDLFLHARF